MIKLNRVLAALALIPALCLAELNPGQGVYDARVRVVDYNPADVVRLTAFYGVSTHVQFGVKESIKDVAIGDEQAWTIVPRGNHLFIKPKAHKADTNVTVVTDVRVYHFALVVEPRKVNDSTAWRDPGLVYSLSFKYPDEDAAKLAASNAAASARQAALNQVGEVKERLDAAKAAEVNRDYWVAGSEEVSPTAAKDDGRFIYLTFSNNRDMPAVYAVDSDGNESLVNTHVQGADIVVQRMVRKLTLRKGNAVACLVNKNFDLNGGTDNTTGTVSPNVERVIKGAK